MPSDLDPVIQLVDAPGAIDPSYQSILIVAADGKARPYKDLKLWNKLWLSSSDTVLYLVGAGGGDKSEAICRALDCTLSSFATQQRLDLRMDCQIRALAGQQGRVAESLHGGSGPREILTNKLREIVDLYIRQACQGDRGAFIAAFDAHRPPLTAWVRQRAAELGLDLTARIYLEGESQVRTESIGPMNLEVCLRDSPDRISLRIEADLAVVQPMVAYLRRDAVAALKQSVQQAIVDYCRTQVTLNSLHYGLPEVQDALKVHIDRYLLGEEGRRVERLILSHSAQTGEVLRALRVEHRIALVLQPGDAEKVEIHCIAQLNLADLGTFRQSGVKDLRGWVCSELDRIVPSALTRLSYVDLCEQIRSKRKQIESEMKSAGTRIGYHLEQMVTNTDLVIDALQTRFQLKVEGKFDSSKSGTQVGVEITVDTSIPTIGKIREFINRRTDVKQLMRQAVHHEAERLLHTISPERFHTRFKPIPGSDDCDESAIANQLGRSIRNRLIKEFGASEAETQVRVDQQKSALSDHLAELLRIQRELPISVVPFGGGAQVDYKVSFMVDAVADEGWTQFVRTMPSLDQVAKELDKRIVADLRQHQAPQLIAQPNEAMCAYLQAGLPDQVQSVYGVRVRITHVGRELGGIERMKTDLFNAQLVEATKTGMVAVQAEFGRQRDELLMFHQAVQTLQSQYLLSVQGGMMERAQELQEQIKELNAQMSQTLMRTQAAVMPGSGLALAFQAAAPMRPLPVGNTEVAALPAGRGGSGEGSGDGQ